MVTARQLDKEKRRLQIVAAARDLFAARGIENVSFGDIAKKAGLSRPLVYFYFPDKQSLLLAAVLQTCEKLHDLFIDAARSPGNGASRVEAMGRAYLEFHVNNPANFYLFAAHEARPDGEPSQVQSMIALHKKIINGLVAQTIREGIADGSVSGQVPPPEIISFCLWAFTHGLAQLVAMKQDALEACGVTTAQVVENGFTLLIRSLAPR